jgi:DNA-binding CsgD family transcriptional regulator
MAKPPGLTDAERARIATLHATGKSCNAIARELGRSASTISRYARDNNLEWGITRTAAAVQANVATNRERRGRLVSRLYDRADKIMDRLDKEQFKLVGLDKDGYARTNIIEADAIPGAEERALTGMVVNLLAGAARMEAVDAGQAGNAHARGILGALQDSLQSAYGQLAHTGGTPTALGLQDELDGG